MPYDRLNPVYLHRLWPDQARWRAGLIQLFCMSTCLWTFGKYLERVLLLPTLAVPAVYMVSGVAGGLASANLAVDRVTVTCTAAICGLVGGGSLYICNALSYCSHFWPCRSRSLCACVMHYLTAYPRVQTCWLVHASLDPHSPHVQVTLCCSTWTFSCLKV